jgi:AP-2 complex subunit alpha
MLTFCILYLHYSFSIFITLSRYPEIKAVVGPIFETHTTALDAELQQRAVEYMHLPEVRAEVLGTVLDAMPPFPERASMLEARVKKASEETTDKDVWGKEGEKTEDAAAARRSRGASLETASIVPASAETDLLGMSSAPVAAPAASAASVPVTTRIGINGAAVERLPGWLQAASTKPSGLVYEDAHIQIGVKVCLL